MVCSYVVEMVLVIHTLLWCELYWRLLLDLVVIAGIDVHFVVDHVGLVEWWWRRSVGVMDSNEVSVVDTMVMMMDSSMLGFPQFCRPGRDAKYQGTSSKQ